MSVSTSPFTNLLVALLHKSILVLSLDLLIPGHEPVFFLLLHQSLVYNPPYLALHEYLEYLFIICFLHSGNVMHQWLAD